MKPLFIFVLLVTSFITQVNAQKEPWLPRSWYFSVGIHKVDVAEFNQSLSAYGLGNFIGYNPSMSFGMNYFRNKWFLGFDISAQTSTTVQSTLYRSNINTAETYVHTGYLLKDRNRWKIYPTLGLGTGFTSLKVEDREIDIHTFSDLLNVRSATVRNFYLSIPIGIHSDFFLGSKEQKWLLGFSFGYTIAPTFGNWNFQELVTGNNFNTSFNDIPTYNPGGWFLKIRVGLSSKVK